MRLTKWRRRILIGYATTVLFLCTIAVPWVHTPMGKKEIVRGSGYAPIWSPSKISIYYPRMEVTPQDLQKLADLTPEEQRKAVEARRFKRTHKIYKRFIGLSSKEQRKAITSLRERHKVYVVPRAYRTTLTRTLDFARLFVELLGLTAVAGVALLLAGPKRLAEEPPGGPPSGDTPPGK